MDPVDDFFEDIEDEIDPEDLHALCPHCGEEIGHTPSCPMADYPFDLEVDVDEDD